MSSGPGKQEIPPAKPQQQALADAAVRISTSLSLAKPIRSILQIVCDEAVEIIGAHMATIGMTVDGNWAHAIQAISLSGKYAAWRSYEETPNGSGIYSLVCATNRPLRLTQDELETHPAFRYFAHAINRHPPLRGWLCVPLVGSDGRNLGVLHLSDKYFGDFTGEDEAIALQLAALAAVAVENHVLYEAVEAANSHKTELLASLHESEEQFRTLANSIPQLAWMADPAGSIFWYNERWFDYTGTTLGEMQGWGWQKVHHPDNVAFVVDKIRRCFESGEVWEDTFPLRGKDGNYRWFLSRAVPIRDQQGRIVRWFGTNTDVTEQRRVGEELREADRLKDAFLATLAHELRNPLAPIRNALELLRSLGPQTPELQWNRDLIDRGLRQMTRLVDDLLDISRISRGKVVLRKQHSDMEAIISRAVEIAKPLIDERQHNLRVSIADQPLFMQVDPARLEQVVTNLLTNAAKYTEPGGQIFLTAEREPGGGVAIQVRDTGIGMTPDFVPHAFEMFAQAEPGKERTRGGLGIGLPLVRALVELHGGTVSAHSAGLGQGSRFTVQLPDSVSPRGDEEKIEGRQSRTKARARRILVVDDHKDSAQSLAMFLRFLGNDVHASYDGPSALEAAAVYVPEVVLLDIGLPGMTGYDVARSLRKLSGLDKAVLIAVTGWGREEDRRLCKEAGFDHHVIKPIDFDVLQKLLEGTQPKLA